MEPPQRNCRKLQVNREKVKSIGLGGFRLCGPTQLARSAQAGVHHLSMPLLAIVGGSDSIIPPERSRALFDAWAGPKTWQLVPGADHNDLGNEETFWRGVVRFLAER